MTRLLIAIILSILFAAQNCDISWAGGGYLFSIPGAAGGAAFCRYKNSILVAHRSAPDGRGDDIFRVSSDGIEDMLFSIDGKVDVISCSDDGNQVSVVAGDRVHIWTNGILSVYGVIKNTSHIGSDAKAVGASCSDGTGSFFAVLGELVLLEGAGIPGPLHVFRYPGGTLSEVGTACRGKVIFYDSSGDVLYLFDSGVDLPRFRLGGRIVDEILGSSGAYLTGAATCDGVLYSVWGDDDRFYIAKILEDRKKSGVYSFKRVSGELFESDRGAEIVRIQPLSAGCAVFYASDALAGALTAIKIKAGRQRLVLSPSVDGLTASGGAVSADACFYLWWVKLRSREALDRQLVYKSGRKDSGCPE